MDGFLTPFQRRGTGSAFDRAKVKRFNPGQAVRAACDNAANMVQGLPAQRRVVAHVSLIIGLACLLACLPACLLACLRIDATCSLKRLRVG